MPEPCYWIDDRAAAIGVKFRVATIRGVLPARTSKEVEQAKRAAEQAVAGTDWRANEILTAYRRELDSVGAVNEVASPQLLLQMVLERGRLTAVNTVVDAYNAVSLSRFVVVSAHDLDRILGNVRLVMTTGTELFHPLRAAAPVTLPRGQWAGVADNHVLCHLNCKQSELSKVTLETRNLLIYVQGNAATSDAYVDDSLRSVCEAIARFNGGEMRYLSPCGTMENE